jgi:hypothetical protein
MDHAKRKQIEQSRRPPSARRLQGTIAILQQAALARQEIYETLAAPAAYLDGWWLIVRDGQRGHAL